MSRSFDELPIELVLPHPRNVRTDLGDLTELADSIKSQGIRQALLVIPHPALDGSYLTVAGHRRRAAALQAGLSTLPCIVDTDLQDQGQQIEIMLTENLQRAEISAVEEAAAYQALLEFPGYTVQKIAKKTGRSQATVKERLKLNSLPGEAKDALDQRQVTLEQAQVLVEFADDEQATAELLKAAGTTNWAWEVKNQARLRGLQERIAALEAELDAAGAVQADLHKEVYSGKWERVYTIDGDTMSVAEHVAAGHKVEIDRHWGKATWYKKRPVPAKDKVAKAEPTPEELEEAQTIRRLTAGIEVAYHVRAEHLAGVVAHPPLGAAQEALVRLIMNERYRKADALAALLGIKVPDSGILDEEMLEASLRLLTTHSLAVLLHILHTSEEEALHRITGWDSRHYSSIHARRWLADLQNLYDYTLSDIETEALAHFDALKATAETGNTDDEQEDTNDGTAA